MPTRFRNVHRRYQCVKLFHPCLLIQICHEHQPVLGAMYRLIARRGEFPWLTANQDKRRSHSHSPLMDFLIGREIVIFHTSSLPPRNHAADESVQHPLDQPIQIKAFFGLILQLAAVQGEPVGKSQCRTPCIRRYVSRRRCNLRRLVVLCSTGNPLR